MFIVGKRYLAMACDSQHNGQSPRGQGRADMHRGGAAAEGVPCIERTLPTAAAQIGT